MNTPTNTASNLNSSTITQRSRAGLDALAAMLKYSSTSLRSVAREDFLATEQGAQLAREHEDGATGAEEVAARVDSAIKVASALPVHRMERFVQRYVAEEMMSRNVVSVEEMRDFHVMQDAAPVEGAGGTLELDGDAPLPAYYEGVHYHLSPHGAEDYDLGAKGGGIGRVFRYGGFAAVPPSSNIGSQRIDVVRQFRQADLGRILEIGCGGVFTLMAIHRVFPEAELIGCDLNGQTLAEGFRIAERMGMKVTLRQRDARDTGEADGSIDGVFSYALHHEAPVEVNREMFREVFRVLRSGGEIVISDPPPFRGVDIFDAVLLEWDNDHREEPYFRETCLANWEDELRAIGFVDVEGYALGDHGYPWVTRAVKP